MAYIQMAVYAETLGMSTDIHMVIPMQSPLRASRGGKLPVLYLLHGLGGDHTEWTRQSSIERYAEAKGVALVLPRADRSYYTDMKQGGLFFTYLSQELPEIVGSLFPISQRREDTFVAGISMGGYGAFKLALRCPEQYAAAASLSGGLDIVRRLSGPNGFAPDEAERIFGSVDAVKGSDNDLFELAAALGARGTQPLLFQCCGTEDFMYEGNQAFLHHARQAGLEITYEEETAGHEWKYWDRVSQRLLEWLPL
ncbi:esterase [Paenibacillus sp. CAA11]|uniref:alpha/beta hydrolase n=1 Tax=Paenibacillus sp. CAA11 TaxID=1532905 RepID=UPI000D3D609B|nr:alpha/beta hydrolase family protein [Paenibacillus sp. CAA11]AWB47023.1 esterase [Paenibacillus sp. CAA11]